jgi:hypothetical protein
VVRDFGAACVDILLFGASDRLFGASAVLQNGPAAGAARLMAKQGQSVPGTFRFPGKVPGTFGSRGGG